MSTYVKPHRGVLILVLGIVSIVFCQFLGIFPWMMANGDLDAMDRKEMDPEGRGLTQAGKICGMVAIGMLALSLVLGAVFLAFLVVAGMASAG